MSIGNHSATNSKCVTGKMILFGKAGKPCKVGRNNGYAALFTAINGSNDSADHYYKSI